MSAEAETMDRADVGDHNDPLEPINITISNDTAIN